jgi:hypothetical protein
MGMEKSTVGFKISGKVYCVKDAEALAPDENTVEFRCLYAEDDNMYCCVCHKTLKEAAE